MDSPLNTSEKKMLLSNAQSDKVPHYLISKITAKMKNENLIQSPVPLIPKSVPGILGLLILTLGLLAAGYAERTQIRGRRTVHENDLGGIQRG